MLAEIQQIISAVDSAYRDFTAAAPSREVQTAVGNAVKFMVADLRSIAGSVAWSPEFWQEWRS